MRHPKRFQANQAQVVRNLPKWYVRACLISAPLKLCHPAGNTDVAAYEEIDADFAQQFSLCTISRFGNASRARFGTFWAPWVGGGCSYAPLTHFITLRALWRLGGLASRLGVDACC